jgi:hypothetical protein
MRRAYEPTFRQYQVDIVFNGHAHSYERSKPMYAWREDPTGCGTVHITLGGSNGDDLAYGYVDEERTQQYLRLKPDYCPCAAPLTPTGDCPAPNPTNSGKPKKPCPYAYCDVDPSKYFLIPAYQPPLTAGVKYGIAPACMLPSAEFPDPLCPTGQPEWSAFRKTTFGVGSLELLSSTRAKWSWYENNLNRNGPSKPQDSVILTRTQKQAC